VRIKITIPPRLATAWDSFSEWINVPIYRSTLRARPFELRRIDVVLVFFFFVCVGYGYTRGWQGALAGGAMYVLMVMTALWLL
jgi:hypothetical protein